MKDLGLYFGLVSEDFGANLPLEFRLVDKHLRLDLRLEYKLPLKDIGLLQIYLTLGL